MSKVMLINVLQPEECRIAILENGVLEELYVERTSHESYVGNIYKGRIVNIEPSIAAARAGASAAATATAAAPSASRRSARPPTPSPPRSTSPNRPGAGWTTWS